MHSKCVTMLTAPLYMYYSKRKRIKRFAPTEMVISEEESVKKTHAYVVDHLFFFSIFIPIENVVISGENNKVIKPL